VCACVCACARAAIVKLWRCKSAMILGFGLSFEYRLTLLDPVTRPVLKFASANYPDRRRGSFFC